MRVVSTEPNGWSGCVVCQSGKGVTEEPFVDVPQMKRAIGVRQTGCDVHSFSPAIVKETQVNGERSLYIRIRKLLNMVSPRFD